MRSPFLRALLLIVPLAVAASACTSNETTFTTPTPVATTDTLSGSLTQGGQGYFYVIARKGTVVTTVSAIGPDASATVGMSVGVLNSLACTALMDNTTATVGSQLLGTTTGTTTVCIRVYDNGTLATDSTLSYELKVDYTK
jgi:hypothetical protein